MLWDTRTPSAIGSGSTAPPNTRHPIVTEPMIPLAVVTSSHMVLSTATAPLTPSPYECPMWCKGPRSASVPAGRASASGPGTGYAEVVGTSVGSGSGPGHVSHLTPGCHVSVKHEFSMAMVRIPTTVLLGSSFPRYPGTTSLSVVVAFHMGSSPVSSGSTLMVSFPGSHMTGSKYTEVGWVLTSVLAELSMLIAAGTVTPYEVSISIGVVGTVRTSGVATSSVRLGLVNGRT